MKPKVKSSKVLYSDFFDLRQDLLERPDGRTHLFHSLILQSNAVVILAQDQAGRYILNQEYRHATGKTLLGAPGGRLEKNEDPLVCAQRELFEETGYWSDEIIQIGRNYPFPGICDQQIFYFYAKNAYHKAKQKLDPFEFIEVALLTSDELKHKLTTTSDVDGLLCTALWYKEQHSC